MRQESEAPGEEDTAGSCPSASGASAAAQAPSSRLTPQSGKLSITLLTVLVALAVVALWLLVHPYKGIRHDARIYFAQAYAWLTPERFADDILLGHDPQASFTIVPLLIGSLVDVFSHQTAGMIVTIAGHGLWLAGAAYLVFSLSPSKRAAIVALIFLIVWPLQYGNSTFGYAENFPTARPFAEALIMFALATAVRGHRLLTIGLAAGAAVFHPIIAAAGIPVALYMLLKGALARRRFIWAGVAAVVLACLALWILSGEIGPAYHQWLKSIDENSPHLFILSWQAADWHRVVWILGILATTWLFGAGILRPLAVITIVGLVLSLALAFVGGDLLSNAFILKVQAWRFLWIAGAIATICAGFLTAMIWQSGSEGPRIALLFLGLLGVSVTWSPVVLLLPVLLVMLKRGALRRVPYFRIWLATLISAFLGLYISTALNSVTGYIGQALQGWQDFFVQADVRPHFLVVTVGEAAILLLLLVPLVFVSQRLSNRHALYALVPVLIAVVFAVTVWNRSLPNVATSGDRTEIAAQLDRVVPKGAKVFSWPSIEVTWFVLRRPSFVSGIQAAPAVFSRRLSDNVFSRKELTLPLGKALAARPLNRAKTGQQFRLLCKRPGAPEFLVYHRRIDAPLAGQVTVQGPAFERWFDGKKHHVERVRHLYVYTCGTVGAEAQQRATQ